ncbi:MAG: hypothetical protein ACQ9MH_11155 [Nitrospinales bacterium]
MFIGAAAGDDNSFSVATPSGWTSVATELSSSTGGEHRSEIFWKVAGPSEGTSTTVTMSGTRGRVIVFAEISGVDTAAVDVEADAVDTGTGDIDHSSGTTGSTSSADSIALVFINHHDDDTTSTSITNSFVEQELVEVQGSDVEGNITGVLATKILTATGTQETTITHTGSVNDAGHGHIVVFSGN